MAIGKKPSGLGTFSDRSPVTVEEGNFGRISAPPTGGLYRRDPAAAYAAALARRAEAYRLCGEPVPAALQAALDRLGGGDTPEIELVDALTGVPHRGRLKVEAPQMSGAETPPGPGGTPEEHGPKYETHDPQLESETEQAQHEAPESVTEQAQHEPRTVPDQVGDVNAEDVPPVFVPQSADESGNSPEGTGRLEAQAAESEPEPEPESEPEPPAEKPVNKSAPAKRAGPRRR
jgi:hypothetical protein